MRILNDVTEYRRTSTSTSRKSLNRDTDNLVELYTLNISQLQATTKKQEISAEKIVCTHLNDCAMKEIDNNCDEI